MIAKKIGFFAFRVHFGPLKLRYSKLYFILIYLKLKDLNVLFYKYSSQRWYLFLNTALEAVGDENRPKFFKANFIPLKLTNLWIFLHNYGQN